MGEGRVCQNGAGREPVMPGGADQSYEREVKVTR